MRLYLTLLAVLLTPSVAYSQFLDGLPKAATLSPSDVLTVCQGGTLGRPGTCTPRQTTVGGISSGAAGPPGPAGATGPTGSIGPAGAVGPIGPMPGLSSPLPIGDTVPNTGAFTTLSATSGGALAGTFSGNKTFTGTTTLNQVLSFGATGNGKYQQNVSAMTMVASPTCAAAQLMWCLQGNPTGSITGSTNFASYVFQDQVQSTGNSDAISIQHNIAPNGNTVTGPRVTLDILQTQVGSNQSGSISNSTISDVLRTTGFMQSNLGGISGHHLGSITTFNNSCQVYASATFVNGCLGVEFDLGSQGGATSYQRNIHAFFAETNDTVSGLLGPPNGVVLLNQQNNNVGLWRGISFGYSGGYPPMNAFGGMISAEPAIGVTPPTTAFGIDFGYMKYKAFSTRQPFRQSVPLQATGITGVTRLTSDGTAASGFILQARLTASGSGYTSEPTATVTGCTSAVVNTGLDASNVLRELGVFTPGSACTAEATVAITSGGGSGGTGVLLISGNTLNFPIKSSIAVNCTIVADTFATGGTDSVSWTVAFGATMGTTASTTAIIGSPVWVVGAATAGAAAKFSGSLPAAPAADTTLGAINLSITPTTGTWNIGGECSMTKSAQI